MSTGVILGSRLSGEFIPWNRTLDPRLKMAWDDLVTVDADAPTFSFPEWLELALQEEAVRYSSVLLIRYGDRPIGLVPLRRRSLLTWDTPTLYNMDCSPILMDQLMEEMAWQGFANWLCGRLRHSTVSLPAINSQRRLHIMEQAFQEQGLVTRIDEQRPSVRLPLAATWHNFFRGLNKSVQSKLRRIEAHMSTAVPGITMDMITGGEAFENAFRDFTRLYCRRWDDRMGGDTCGDRRSVAVYRNFARWAVEEGHGVIPVIRKDGRMIAAGLVFHIQEQSVIHFHMMVRDTEALPPHWLNSPGTALICQVIRWAISRNARMMSLGPEVSHYTRLFGGEQHDLWQVTVANSPLMLATLPAIDRTLDMARRLPLHLRYRLKKWGRRLFLGERDGRGEYSTLGEDMEQ
ncbi:MAG: GNAT family N-acetyltransferase [Armatimonadota bacterium]